MKAIVVFSCLIVIASALRTNQNENVKKQDLIKILTSDVLDTQQIGSDVIRSKRQFGGNIFSL